MTPHRAEIGPGPGLGPGCGLGRGGGGAHGAGGWVALLGRGFQPAGEKNAEKKKNGPAGSAGPISQNWASFGLRPETEYN